MVFVEKKGKKKYLNLFEFEDNSEVDNEVRDWAAIKSGNHYTIADAFVIKNFAQKILTNFYLRFNKPQKPSKVFNNTGDAINWLLSIKNN